MSPIVHLASVTQVVFCVSSPLLPPPHGPVPRFPSLSSGPPHGATFSLGLRILRLWLLVTRWRHPLSRVFRPASTITSYYTIILLYTIVFTIIVFRVLSPLHPPLRSRPRSPPYPCHRPRSCSRPRPHPCSCHRFLLTVPGGRFSPRYHIGQAPGLAPGALLATCKRHLLYAEMVPRTGDDSV